MIAVSFALVACKSAEEQAEEYFQSAVELYEAGDTQRAVIELRNTFQFQETHREARLLMAEIRLEQGNISSAYSNYLFVAELDPEDAETRVILSEIAFETRNWEEFERHSEVVIEALPERTEVKAIDLGRQYFAAVQDEEPSDQREAAREALALMNAAPDNFILTSILIDHSNRTGDYDTSLALIDRRIEQNPDDRALYNERLAVLARMDQPEQMETQLREMVSRFPDDIEIRRQLLNYYIAQGNVEAAEEFLREIAAPDDEDPNLFLTLVRFVLQTKGYEAAMVEADRAIAENPNPDMFRAVRASMKFDAGLRDEAIAEMEQMLEGAEPGETTDNNRVIFANMLLQTGNEVGARSLVEQTLASDVRHVEALKMQAAWQIQADETDAAIAGLRVALEREPEDYEAMGLMAQAYVRAGSPNLARDFLALAVDASNNAPGPSIRYARLLMEDERYTSAEDILITALRRANQNADVIALLGELYLRMEDYGRAQQVVDTLQRFERPATSRAATQLQAELTRRQQGVPEALEFLEQTARNAPDDLSNQLLLLRAQLQSGDTKSAITTADRLSRDNPDNPSVKLALATARSLNGDYAGAETIYRGLLEDNQQSGGLWLALMRVQQADGRMEEALVTLEEGLTVLPDDVTLLWVKASLLERDGEIDAAIAVYEDLYERHSNSTVIANNLASLIATYSDDEESLDRAWTIARRLSGTDVPAMQDTYGWIQHRRGNSEDALPYLEGAATGLPDDPNVQIHLGLAYSALGETEKALVQLRKGLEIAGPLGAGIPVERAQAEIARLTSPTVEN